MQLPIAQEKLLASENDARYAESFRSGEPAVRYFIFSFRNETLPDKNLIKLISDKKHFQYLNKIFSVFKGNGFAKQDKSHGQVN